MTAAIAAVAAGTGVHLLWTALALGRSDLQVRRRRSSHRPSITHRLDEWMRQAGLGQVSRTEFVTVVVALGVATGATAALIFGGIAPAIPAALFGATFPVAGYRMRRRRQVQAAQDAWPRMIEEIRILTASVGRSIPQALLEVGLRGPEELRPAFGAAQREWVLTTDFGRTLALLKERLADPTADVACETLLVAHEIGGADLDDRLAALIEDRHQELNGRRDARAKQAGVRFARRFVLLVPLGMALAGMTVGDGRAAYRTATGQLAVVVAIGLIGLCWIWSGRLMHLPDDERVFR